MYLHSMLSSHIQSPFYSSDCILLDGFGRKIKSLYKKQPQTIVVTAFKNGSREIFHRIAAPNLKMVRIYK